MSMVVMTAVGMLSRPVMRFYVATRKFLVMFIRGNVVSVRADLKLA